MINTFEDSRATLSEDRGEDGTHGQQHRRRTYGQTIGLSAVRGAASAAGAAVVSFIVLWIQHY